MDDLLVVGLDLSTGLEVHAADRPVPEWRRKGHNGDQTLACQQCHQGLDLPAGSRTVALVPKGRVGGARRPHFAHPPGMAPPDGRHNPESRWHALGKQMLARWAARQGGATRIEAYTPDGRRRSDVAVALPGGVRVSFEVQYRLITDAEWLDRHDDYARAGITDVWLWHERLTVPRIVYTRGQPGWLLGSELDRVGLCHATPPAPEQVTDDSSCGDVHWPPCLGDAIDVLWMPLAQAVLAGSSLLPSPQASRVLADRAATARARSQKSPRAPGTNTARRTAAKTPDLLSSDTARRRLAELQHRPLPPHRAIRYDARPPWTDPLTWWFLCHLCGGKTYTGAELRSSPIPHYVDGCDLPRESDKGAKPGEARS